MSWLFQRPLDLALPIVLLALAVLVHVRGTRLFRRGLANPDHPSQTLWVVRGIRGWIIALSLFSLAAGIYLHVTWPLWVGAIFLGEELLETGIMILALRAQAKREQERRS